MIRIDVSDTGKGIEERDLAHIFDPYFTTKPSGTGLGLAIVYRIIEAHDGEIRVKSKPGKGPQYRSSCRWAIHLLLLEHLSIKSPFYKGRFRGIFDDIKPPPNPRQRGTASLPPLEKRVSKSHGRLQSMKAKSTILVVDDDLAHRTMLRTLLGGWGYDVAEADDGEKAIEAVHQKPFDLILMDIRMVRVSGLEALAEIKKLNPAIPVVIMTAYASVETAVKALKEGAYDYLTKPLDFDELKFTIERAMEHTRLKEENRHLRESLASQFNRQNLIGRSPAMARLMDTIAQVAPSEATVLITGESGTGKEMIAGAIHFNSLRKDGPFVKINCAAITETLLESELFGHEKGAFTGADRRKEGKFRQAEGGTIFLDEVSEMSPAMQVKLLRVLQEREITRVGGDEVIKVDVRVIAATNKDLIREMEAGRFRDDLYYRLNVVTINVPPLRERREDIPLIAQHFLNMFAEEKS